MHHDRLARVLARAPGRRRAAAASATASQVACSSRPRASLRPRQSSSGCSPAKPIATSICPWRQARPKLSVISTAGARAACSSRRRARMRRAERVGVARQQHDSVLGAGGV